MNEPRTCRRCVMTSAYPGIAFDDEGICSMCRDEENAPVVDWALRRRELDERVDRIKQEATSYHAIIPWSGGKDSSYALYVMKEIYGLDVLALNFDNGFRSLRADRNLDTLSRRLGVDLVTVRPDPDLMSALYRHYLREKGELCSVCNVIGYLMVFSFVLKLAASLGYLPLIVGGWSGAHENVREIFTFDLGELRRVLETDASLVARLEASRLVDPKVGSILAAAGDPRVGATAINDDVAAKFFHLPDFLEWDIMRIRGILTTELGWSCSDSPIAAHEDCRWHSCMKYLMLKKYSIDNDTVAVAALVRSGGMSREEGLELVARTSQVQEPREMDELLELIGCSRAEVNLDAEWYTGENVQHAT